LKKVIVKNKKGKTLVVQDVMIPNGYIYVKDYVEKDEKKVRQASKPRSNHKKTAGEDDGHSGSKKDSADSNGQI